jgi:hypothetical protein
MVSPLHPCPDPRTRNRISKRRPNPLQQTSQKRKRILSGPTPNQQRQDQPIVGRRLSLFRKAWANISKENWVRSIISTGFKISFTSPPPTTATMNSIHSTPYTRTSADRKRDRKLVIKKSSRSHRAAVFGISVLNCSQYRERQETVARF